MEPIITYGTRGEKFLAFIQNMLSKGKIKQKYIQYLTDKDAMDLYAQAFTNPTADANNNYEFFEKLGDSTCNKIITWYIYRKYPKLSVKPQGVMIITRLSHLMRSTEIFSALALRLGFEEFISVGYMMTVKKVYEPVMKVKRSSVLEDCFESFFGVTEFIIDSRFREGVGYAICNEIFKALLNDIELPSIKYENLFDSVTRLKELFDCNHFQRCDKTIGKLGTFKYIDEHVEECDGNGFVLKKVYVDYTNWLGHTSRIAEGHGSLKEKAKILAAERALVYFKDRGFFKKPLYDYKEFL